MFSLPVSQRCSSSFVGPHGILLPAGPRTCSAAALGLEARNELVRLIPRISAWSKDPRTSRKIRMDRLDTRMQPSLSAVHVLHVRGCERRGVRYGSGVSGSRNLCVSDIFMFRRLCAPLCSQAGLTYLAVGDVMRSRVRTPFFLGYRIVDGMNFLDMFELALSDFH